MERHFNNDFERFLKENADQYRLYPSTKTWKGIYAHFHGRRKWFGLGAILLLLTGSLITVLIINSPKENPIAERPAANNATEQRSLSAATTNNATIPGIDISATNKNSVPIFNNDVPSAISSSVLQDQGGLSPFTPAYSTIAGNTGNSSSVNAVERFSSLQSSPLPLLLAPVNVSLSDEFTDQDLYAQTMKQQNTTNTPQQNIFQQNLLPWTIESVLNSYKRKAKVGLQFNFTPTISYRKLSENEAHMHSASSQNAYLYNINDAVTHKPAIGLELGLTAKYPISQNIKLKAGIQFNVNRYDIKAYDYPIEPATIALANGSRVDSLHTISVYRNFNGNNPNWLQNLYFQVAMPIGIEYRIVGDDKVQFGIAGTIQPLYVLSDKAYLLTTDYKNYTEDSEAPGLIRRWNANTALETYVSYSTGKLKWQVGPQMRYQILSSYVKKYPVKEHLFDFGLKVGISLNTP